MKSCRMASIVPRSGYTVESIDRILLIDFEDFKGLSFEEIDGVEVVTQILRDGQTVEINTKPEVSKASSEPSGGVYTHTLETFVETLDQKIISSLHLAMRRRYLVLFHTQNGEWCLFGKETGAGLTYKVSTAGGIGESITLTAMSLLPIMGVTPTAISGPTYRIRYVPNFNYADCIVSEDGGVTLPFQQSYIALAVSDPGGEKVDADGKLCKDSGHQQASLLLEGKPDPGIYVTVGRFAPKSVIDGQATVHYNPGDCPIRKRVTVTGKISEGSTAGCMGLPGVIVGTLENEKPLNTLTDAEGRYSLVFYAEAGQEYELSLSYEHYAEIYLSVTIPEDSTTIKCNGAICPYLAPLVLRTGKGLSSDKNVEVEFSMPSNDTKFVTILRFDTNGDGHADFYAMAKICDKLGNCIDHGQSPFLDPVFASVTIDNITYESGGFYPPADNGQPLIVLLGISLNPE